MSYQEPGWLWAVNAMLLICVVAWVTVIAKIAFGA